MAVVKERYCKNRIINGVHEKILEWKFFLRCIPRIKIIANEPSFYPEEPRKTYKQRKKDLIKWLIKYNEANENYNEYGQDIQSCKDYDDYISTYDFIKLRRNEMRKNDEKLGVNYEVILQNKIAFNNFFKSCLKHGSVSDMIANINCGKVNLLGLSEEEFFEKYSSQIVIIKPSCEDSGRGVFKAEICQNGFFYNNNLHSMDYLLNDVGQAPHIIEKYIIQSDETMKLNPTSLNTFRVVTVINRQTLGVSILAISLRMGASKEKCTDNAGDGGIAVRVNLDGSLGEIGKYYKKFGKSSKIHPISNITFKGYKITRINEVIELAINAHKNLPEILTIGWDIALTETGCIVIEGNPDWSLPFTQATYGPIRHETEKIFKGVNE